jgi:CRP-like cAMP-binding protein
MPGPEPLRFTQPRSALEAFLLAHARPGARQFSRGHLLVAAQVDAAFVYVIRRGCVRTYLLSRTGTETTTALLGPGDVVGIASLLGLPAYHCFAEAQTAVEVWAVHDKALRDALDREPQAWALLVPALAHRLAWTQAQLRDVGLLPVPARVRNVRTRLAHSFQGQPPRLTRVVLAAVVASRRETVSRALHASSAAPAPPVPPRPALPPDSYIP